jgi:hypothetical protein
MDDSPVSRPNPKEDPDQPIHATILIMWISRRIPPTRPVWAALFAFSAGVLSAQATLEGTVVNSVTRAGLEGVSVKFYTQQGVRYETTTGGGGTFRIAGMRDGDYRSTLEKEGFLRPKPSDFPMPEPVTRVSGDQTFRVSLEMVPWTTLRGRVVDADGKPAAKVLVRLFGPSAAGPDGGLVVSGDDGSFAFTRLLPGKFILLAKPEPAKVAPAGGLRVEAVATYYPSEIEPSQAQTITIRGTGEEAGYEIRLRRVPVHRVRGIVLDETGKAARGIKVQIAQPGSPLSQGWRSTLGRVDFYLPRVSPFDPVDEDGVLTGAGGTFEFPSVREGEWTIRAASQWEYQEDTRRDIRRVGEARALVSRDDVDDVEIRLASNFEVTASAEWPEGTTLHNWGMIMLWPAEATMEPPTAQPERDGTLHFERVYPGRYYVIPLTSGVAGTYVATVLFDGRDVLGHAIDLNSPPPTIRVFYKSNAGTVRATFQRGETATLMVIPAEFRSGGVPRSVRCDTGAPCELANLRPGEYYVAAFDHVDGVKLSNPAYLPDIVARMTNIRVEEGAAAAVELTVSRWPD